MPKLSSVERPATPADNINWLTAPAVPVKVMQMYTSGKVPAGQILTGPNGQKTYRGSVTPREIDNSWRDGLSQLPD